MKKKKKRKVLYLIFSIIIVILCSLFLYYKLTFLDNLINKKRNEWDLPLIQSTIISGEYMGLLYENNYSVNDLSNEEISSLFVDYYIYNDPSFFEEKNKDDNNFYRKSLSYDTVKNTFHKMFGPDYKIPNLVNVNYGCGRYLIKQGKNYLISSYDEDSCGLCEDDTDGYLTRIIDYYKEKDKIYIKMKIGYLERTKDENTEEVTAKIYDTKYKNNLLNPNYNIDCYYTDEPGKICYNSFNNYTITLLKASNNKYYFDNIKKE